MFWFCLLCNNRTAVLIFLIVSSTSFQFDIILTRNLLTITHHTLMDRIRTTTLFIGAFCLCLPIRKEFRSFTVCPAEITFCTIVINSSDSFKLRTNKQMSSSKNCDTFDAFAMKSILCNSCKSWKLYISCVIVVLASKCNPSFTSYTICYCLQRQIIIAQVPIRLLHNCNATFFREIIAQFFYFLLHNFCFNS